MRLSIMDESTQIPNLKTNKVLVNVILDRSGSMASTRALTISGYNEYINGLRFDKDTEYSVSLVQFDAPVLAPELTVSYLDRGLADVPALSAADYEPRGNTPLYDAIGECLRRIEAKSRAIIVLIITDGMENASAEFTKESIKALIKSKEAEGWTFAFLGANIDSFGVGGSIGIAPGNIANYVQGNEELMFGALIDATVVRAHVARQAGIQPASFGAFLSQDQQEELAGGTKGGLPPAQPSFRSGSPKPVVLPEKVESNPRNWRIATN
ncbi:MAG: VWA domain-containing protein, partial [Acidobacteriota bacterium]|nr:VWA domain-containing protein [Acidobacteriota bacterium]